MRNTILAMVALLSFSLASHAQLNANNEKLKEFKKTVSQDNKQQSKSVDPHMDAEIQHLLYWVGGQRCSLIRNEYHYAMMDYIVMMERKYQHLKGRIRNTEQFIKYAGAGSISSGKPYRVSCRRKDHDITGYEFLMTELKNYRTQMKEAS